jgi:hypothetical protein
MSEFTLEISDINYIIDIETSTEDNTENLEITTTNADTIEVTTSFAASIVYASDVIGLDNYLTNFIDSYNIDCGTP